MKLFTPHRCWSLFRPNHFFSTAARPLSDGPLRYALSGRPEQDRVINYPRSEDSGTNLPDQLLHTLLGSSLKSRCQQQRGVRRRRLWQLRKLAGAKTGNFKQIPQRLLQRLAALGGRNPLQGSLMAQPSLGAPLQHRGLLWWHLATLLRREASAQELLRSLLLQQRLWVPLHRFKQRQLQRKRKNRSRGRPAQQEAWREGGERLLAPLRRSRRRHQLKAQESLGRPYRPLELERLTNRLMVSLQPKQQRHRERLQRALQRSGSPAKRLLSWLRGGSLLPRHRRRPGTSAAALKQLQRRGGRLLQAQRSHRRRRRLRQAQQRRNYRLLLLNHWLRQSTAAANRLNAQEEARALARAKLVTKRAKAKAKTRAKALEKAQHNARKLVREAAAEAAAERARQRTPEETQREELTRGTPERRAQEEAEEKTTAAAAEAAAEAAAAELTRKFEQEDLRVSGSRDYGTLMTAQTREGVTPAMADRDALRREEEDLLAEERAFQKVSTLLDRAVRLSRSRRRRQLRRQRSLSNRNQSRGVVRNQKKPTIAAATQRRPRHRWRLLQKAQRKLVKSTLLLLKSTEKTTSPKITAETKRKLRQQQQKLAWQLRRWRRLLLLKRSLRVLETPALWGPSRERGKLQRQQKLARRILRSNWRQQQELLRKARQKRNNPRRSGLGYRGEVPRRSLRQVQRHWKAFFQPPREDGFRYFVPLSGFTKNGLFDWRRNLDYWAAGELPADYRRRRYSPFGQPLPQPETLSPAQQRQNRRQLLDYLQLELQLLDTQLQLREHPELLKRLKRRYFLDTQGRLRYPLPTAENEAPNHDDAERTAALQGTPRFWLPPAELVLSPEAKAQQRTSAEAFYAARTRKPFRKYLEGQRRRLQRPRGLRRTRRSTTPKARLGQALQRLRQLLQQPLQGFGSVSRRPVGSEESGAASFPPRPRKRYRRRFGRRLRPGRGNLGQGHHGSGLKNQPPQSKPTNASAEASRGAAPRRRGR